MDYKYIEQLLDRYWLCETTPEEENILRAFFAQNDVPAELARYKALFVYQRQQADVKLNDDFDERVCRLAETQTPQVVRARRVNFAARLRPLYHAAASVAIVVLMGTAAQHIFTRPDADTGWDYNANTYQDSYDNPQEAYETLSSGIEELKGVLTTSRDSSRTDSMAMVSIPKDQVRP